jgi:SAM-dependent methyltransferase
VTGFSADWLALREPADAAARDAALRIEAAAYADRRAGFILDLGCGTGSTVRALPIAPARWRLVDNDPRLLAEAARRTGAETVAADLAELDPALVEGAALVTASALLDLVSRPWLEALAGHLASAGAGLYAALNYDGRMLWDDAHPLDAGVVAAFNAHQRGDKGFGPALGPDAATALTAIMELYGYRVASAASDWRLGPDDAALQKLFLEGVASAVRETGEVDPAAIDGWLAHRLATIPTTRCTVGHIDLLCLPG